MEKADENDAVLCALESNGRVVVRKDWRMYIHEDVVKDLRKYRTYRGGSVRDLLRALRNKVYKTGFLFSKPEISVVLMLQKHHFRELTPEAQKAMGETPEEFTSYWLARFPLLLVHTWTVMQCVAKETTFSQYYPDTYRYASLDYTEYEGEKYLLEQDEHGEELPKNVEEVADFMAKKSPRKQQQKVSFYEQRNRQFGRRSEQSRMNFEAEEKYAVGLYRNLAAVENMMDVSDAKVQLSDETVNTKHNRHKHRRSPNVRQRPKKQVDEPLTWSVPDT